LVTSELIRVTVALHTSMSWNPDEAKTEQISGENGSIPNINSTHLTINDTGLSRKLIEKRRITAHVFF
jgi:hypothetical protein